MAAKQLIDLSRSQASETTGDLLGSPAVSQVEKKKKTGPFDAVICIGLVIKGGTAHFEYICDAVTHGIMRVQLDTGVPVIFGVLTCYNEEQAIARSSTQEGFTHAEEWAAAAVEAGPHNIHPQPGCHTLIRRDHQQGQRAGRDPYRDGE